MKVPFQSYYKQDIKNTIKYFIILSVKYHFLSAIFGFFIILTIVSQLLSGVMLAFSLIPEPMLIPIIRDEEDLEDLYTDDFFWLHERGVDLLFIFSYCHLLRKMYLNIFYLEQEFAWKSGVFSFMIFQVVTFFGLSLCCTHLSDITLSIATNIMHTFLFFFKGKAYWWLFTDKKLNTDTLVRIAYIHYIVAFYLFFLGFLHAIDMHYDWKQDNNLDGLDTDLLWLDEALSSELSCLLDVFAIGFLTCLYLYTEPEALSYEIFMWGDIGLVTDVRFYGVAPHWYFRPFMAWLTVCPMHIEGIFGLLFFFFAVYHQPTITGYRGTCTSYATVISKGTRQQKLINPKHVNPEVSFMKQFLFYIFFMSLMYTTTFLPAGRYYQRVYGNTGLLVSYLYVLFYLLFSNVQNPQFMDSYNKGFYRQLKCVYRLY